LVENRYGFTRTLSLTLPHGEVLTPVYMPVGTKGAMKGITYRQMEQIDCRIMLSNTLILMIWEQGLELILLDKLEDFTSL
jgi:tRNA-guanine family transglycosylase